MSHSTSILEFSQDISDAQPPPPLPVGPYPAEIVGVQTRVSATTGNEYVQVTFRVNSDSYPADFTEGDPDGTVLMYNRLTTEDTPTMRYRWRKFLENVGGPRGRKLDLGALVGLRGPIDIAHQENEGEQRPTIARILAPGYEWTVAFCDCPLYSQHVLTTNQGSIHGSTSTQPSTRHART